MVALTVVVLDAAVVGGLDAAGVGLDVADAGRDFGGPARGLQQKKKNIRRHTNKGLHKGRPITSLQSAPASSVVAQQRQLFF